MALRNQVEWALHCCAVLAGLSEEERLATKTLAEFHGVPKEYLSKALQALATAGLIEGTLGPTGGYRLAKAAKDISILQIVEAIEGESHHFECTEIRGNSPCLKKTERKFNTVCSVAKIMYRAEEAWKKELRSTSLQDLVNNVVKEVPADLLQRNHQWLTSK